MAQPPPHPLKPEAAAPAVQHLSDSALCCAGEGTQVMFRYYGISLLALEAAVSWPGPPTRG